MMFEKSCGAVVYNQVGNKIEFLVIKHKNGEHWGFPKGHVEQGESEEETALREVNEETGLDIELLEGFTYKMKYSPKIGTIKEVIYFIGKPKGTSVKCQESEIVDYKWLSLKDGIETVTHENSRKLLRQAYFYILKKKRIEL